MLVIPENVRVISQWVAGDTPIVAVRNRRATFEKDSILPNQTLVCYRETQQAVARADINPAQIARMEYVSTGQVDAQNGITASDALLVLQVATAKATVEADQMLSADVNGNNRVDAEDALLILQYATQKIQAFPFNF